MSFIRRFDITETNRLAGADAEIFARLKADVLRGEVFPAVRRDELYFYYGGGCLYRLTGSKLIRAAQYDKPEYSDGTNGLDAYEKAKKQNKNKHARLDGVQKERQLLDTLYCNTFDPRSVSRTVVLDIEVRLNGAVCGNKKCDMVLLDTYENRIMFVEGKVFSDCRVNVAAGRIPEVIEQVKGYMSAVAEQRDTITRQYGEHIRIVNALFGTAYADDVTLDDQVKLLVYDKPKRPNANGSWSMDKINFELGENNVAWFDVGERPSIDDIRSTLCR